MRERLLQQCEVVQREQGGQSLLSGRPWIQIGEGQDGCYCGDRRTLGKDSSLKSFGKKRKKDRSVVVEFREAEGGFLQGRVNAHLLQRFRELATWEGAVNKMGEKGKKVRNNSLENVRRDGVKGQVVRRAEVTKVRTWLRVGDIKGDKEEIDRNVLIKWLGRWRRGTRRLEKIEKSFWVMEKEDWILVWIKSGLLQERFNYNYEEMWYMTCL